jgi:hypothetical protein
MVLSSQAVVFNPNQTCTTVNNAQQCTASSWEGSPASITVTSNNQPLAFQVTTANGVPVPNWLSINSSTGKLNIGVVDSVAENVQPGDSQTGFIFVSASGVSNSPQLITVELVAPSHCNGTCVAPEQLDGPATQVIQTQIDFNSGASLSAQETISTSVGKILTLVPTNTLISVTYAGNGTSGWLSVPSVTGLSGTVPVTASTAGLSSGTYLAWINFTPSCDGGKTSCSGTTTVYVSLTAAPLALPSISGLNPPTVVAGSGVLALYISGSNFVSGSVVNWNGTALATTFVSASQLAVTVPASFLAAPGTFSVVVTNPDGSSSSSQSFSVSAPAPVLTSLSPSSIAQGNGNVSLSISGTGFTSNSTVQLNGVALATTYVSPAQLQAQIPASNFVTPATLQITVVNADGQSSKALPFIVSAPSTSGMQFEPATPCRIFDTRGVNAPYMQANTQRTIVVAVQSIAVVPGVCNVPTSAQAYSLNFTVVPKAGKVSSLVVWPTGQTQPNVTTLTSHEPALAIGSIVPAGTDSSINAWVSDDTDLIIDINGYFVPPGSGTLQFYAVAPCRILDTRNPNGVFGGPSIPATGTRSYPVPSGGCNIPANASAYSLNLGVLPQPVLGFLTAWPDGQPQPYVSSMNSWQGTVLANDAIVPAGPGGIIDFYATDKTDLFVDINGYFAPPGKGGLNFYPVNPCRLVDTRNASGPLGGPSMGAAATRPFPLASGTCGIPSSVEGYALTMTVYPQKTLGYLSVWPTGGPPQTNVSTLNAWAGTPVGNGAIVPAGTNGSIDVFTTDATDLTIDTAGYFAP